MSAGGQAVEEGGRARLAPWRGVLGEALKLGGELALFALLVAAPLLAGSVHRPAATAVLAAVLLALVMGAGGELLRGRGVRGTRLCHVFALLLAIPLLQIVPLPAAVRGVLDPAGARLLENAPAGVPAFWPLSLDPHGTRLEVGTAAAALVVFLLAFHTSSGRPRFVLVARALAVAGVLALVSGIVHRLFGIDQLYGMFRDSGAILPGPFINANHAAEFYELCAFATLALAFDSAAEARLGWFAVSALMAAAAVATLSRGSLLGLIAGGAVFVVLRARAVDPEGGAGAPGGAWRKLAGTVGALGVVVAMVVALGATPIVAELERTDLANKYEKISIWKDSLAMVPSHPAGVGRHAYARVQPAYKRLGWNARFEFVENAPLQLLIEVGWLGFAAVGLSLGLFLRQSRRLSRGDDVEAALIAGLVAVAAHNLVDFGVEVPGIRLPAAALAGALLGRMRGQSRPGGRRAPIVALGAVAAVGLIIGLVARWQTSALQLEQRWKATASPAARRQIAVEGGLRFPTDYYFPYLEARDEPLAPDAATRRSRKLAALNRALRLCPACRDLHRASARALWALGRRAQAMGSWRDAIKLDGDILPESLVELDRAGATPGELASLAVGGGTGTMQVLRFLIGKKAAPEVAALMEQARREGVGLDELAIDRADLAVALGQGAQARRTLEEVLKGSPRNPRALGRLAELAAREGRLDEALGYARTAEDLAPLDVGHARRYLELVVRGAQWKELDAALDALRAALRHEGAPITEVYLHAGAAYRVRGNHARALVEFRQAVVLEPDSVAGWSSVAAAAEALGDLETAGEAYRKMTTLQPDDRGWRDALQKLERMKNEARLRTILR